MSTTAASLALGRTRCSKTSRAKPSGTFTSSCGVLTHAPSSAQGPIPSAGAEASRREDACAMPWARGARETFAGLATLAFKRPPHQTRVTRGTCNTACAPQQRSRSARTLQWGKDVMLNSKRSDLRAARGSPRIAARWPHGGWPCRTPLYLVDAPPPGSAVVLPEAFDSGWLLPLRCLAWTLRPAARHPCTLVTRRCALKRLGRNTLRASERTAVGTRHHTVRRLAESTACCPPCRLNTTAPQ